MHGYYIKQEDNMNTINCNEWEIIESFKPAGSVFDQWEIIESLDAGRGVCLAPRSWLMNTDIDMNESLALVKSDNGDVTMYGGGLDSKKQKMHPSSIAPHQRLEFLGAIKNPPASLKTKITRPEVLPRRDQPLGIAAALAAAVTNRRSHMQSSDASDDDTEWDM